jgi:hypothetical protein
MTYSQKEDIVVNEFAMKAAKIAQKSHIAAIKKADLIGFLGLIIYLD